MSLAIVILNYRTAALTCEALASVVPCLGEWPGARVILVDNASGDGSADQLAEAMVGLKAPGEFVVSEANLGFAGGNNLALKRLQPSDRAVLLLNSDTILRPGVLAHFYERFEREDRVGIYSCRLESADGSLQGNARKMPTPARLTAHMLGLTTRWPARFKWADTEDTAWDRRETREVEWVGGAFMLIRRDVIDRVGGLDASFFFYGEDAEYCARVREEGWQVVYDGRVGIVHLGGGSSDPAKLSARARNRHSWEARYLLQRRVYGPVAEWYVRGLDLITYGLRCLKLALTPSREADYRVHREILSVLWNLGSERGARHA